MASGGIAERSDAGEKVVGRGLRIGSISRGRHDSNENLKGKVDKRYLRMDEEEEEGRDGQLYLERVWRLVPYPD